MTKYRVLRTIRAAGVPDGAAFELLAENVESHGPTQAIRKVAGEQEDAAGDYHAIPELNWTSEPVVLEQPPPRIRVGGQADPQLTLPPAEEEEPDA